MIRRLIQFHTVVMAAVMITIIMAPSTFLRSLGAADVSSFDVMALTRIIAVLVVVAAAAVLQLAYVSPARRSGALFAIGSAYMIAALMLILQEIAIWNTVGGAIAAGIPCVLAVGFVGVGLAERRPQAVASAG